MKTKIKVDRERIAAFCRKWKIIEFSFFGSVIRDDFQSGSDVDVLVSFDQNAGWSLLDLVEMRDELKEMLGREIDLVEEGALRNPFRKHAILTTKEIQYAA